MRSVLAKWNAINAESKKIVLLPVGWETHSAPEAGRAAQDYINEDILDECDILIGVFRSIIGTPTKNFGSGTVEEIVRHIGERKLAMLYFSKQDLPNDADLDQVREVRELKKRYQNQSLYSEYSDLYELENQLYNHIQIKINEGKFRPNFDSDYLAKIKDDDELVVQIENHFPLVSKNLLKVIVDEKRADIVWDAIVAKLQKSPADFRDSLIYLGRRGAFKHPVFLKGYKVLASCSQPDFGNFMSSLYSFNEYEFYDILEQDIFEDSPFKSRLFELINED